MAEIYEDKNNILKYPPVTDYSFDLQLLTYYFSRAYRHHCKSCVNRYMFSYDNDFFAIMPIRSQYRILGRVDMFAPVKRSKYFDTFYEGSFDDCLARFNGMLRTYGLYLSDSCT